MDVVEAGTTAIKEFVCRHLDNKPFRFQLLPALVTAMADQIGCVSRCIAVPSSAHMFPLIPLAFIAFGWCVGAPSSATVVLNAVTVISRVASDNLLDFAKYMTDEGLPVLFRAALAHDDSLDTQVRPWCLCFCFNRTELAVVVRTDAFMPTSPCLNSCRSRLWIRLSPYHMRWVLTMHSVLTCLFRFMFEVCI